MGEPTMDKRMTRVLIVAFIYFVCTACSQVPSTQDLDNDIGKLDAELKAISESSEKYTGGLIKTLIEVRGQILSTTRAMLDQKRSAFRRFIPIKYEIDGNAYNPPENKQELLESIRDSIAETQSEITDVQRENGKYSGGLIKSMILMRLAMLENTLAFLKQRELLLEHDIPYYANLPKNENDQKGRGFKPTPGKDVDKF